MHYGLVLCLLTAVNTHAAPAAPALPAFTHVPEVRRWVEEQSVFADIVNRCPTEPFRAYGRTTNAHETGHQVAASLSVLDQTDAYYVLRGRSVRMRPPRLSRRDLARAVPEGLRGNAYRDYAAPGATAGNGKTNGAGTVRDVLEEWTAHVNDMEVALDDLASGGRTVERPSCYTALELGVVAAAYAREIQRRDPGYWESEPQFRLFVRWQWGRMLDLIERCRGETRFFLRANEEYVRKLHDAPDGAALRDWVNANLK